MISIRWVCQDWATPVNLPRAVNFTDTDPGIGSYGGIVDLVAKSDAPKSLVKTTFLEGLRRELFLILFLDSVVPLFYTTVVRIYRWRLRVQAMNQTFQDTWHFGV